MPSNFRQRIASPSSFTLFSSLHGHLCKQYTERVSISISILLYQLLLHCRRNYEYGSSDRYGWKERFQVMCRWGSYPLATGMAFQNKTTAVDRSTYDISTAGRAYWNIYELFSADMYIEIIGNVTKRNFKMLHWSSRGAVHLIPDCSFGKNVPSQFCPDIFLLQTPACCNLLPAGGTKR